MLGIDCYYLERLFRKIFNICKVEARHTIQLQAGQKNYTNGVSNE